MNIAFLLFATFLFTTQPLRNTHFCKNRKINSIIDCCSNRDEPCSNSDEPGGSTKLKKIIDALLRPQKIPPKITRECEEGDWESGEIPWDFVKNKNVSVALDPYSIVMLLL